jgi:hypothetical protein
LEKSNPQSRLGCASNYGFTVILETIPRKKGSISGISNPRFQGQKSKSGIPSVPTKFNYSSELPDAKNQLISKIRPWKL